VIGLNLCPFAKNALLSGGLMVEVFPGSDADDLREDVVEKAATLAEGAAGGTVRAAQSLGPSLDKRPMLLLSSSAGAGTVPLSKYQ
jgi:hypothetical protein